MDFLGIPGFPDGNEEARVIRRLEQIADIPVLCRRAQPRLSSSGSSRRKQRRNGVAAVTETGRRHC